MTTIDVLKEMLDEYKRTRKTLDQYFSDEKEQHLKLTAEIAAMTDAIRQLEWTPVSERLPMLEDAQNQNKQVLVWLKPIDEFDKTGMLAACPYYEIRNDPFNSNFTERITHCRPLPAAPESEDAK